MKKYIIVILLCVTGVLSSIAQTAKKKNWYVIPQVGLLNGSSSVSAQGMIIAGKEYANGWSAGFGAGIDYYRVRTVPVIFDLRKNITTKDWPVFLYANLGVDIPAPLPSQYKPSSPWNSLDDTKYLLGWYAESGIGYAMPKAMKRGFVISLGYTTKTFTEKYTELIYRDFPPYGSEQSEKRLRYTLNRIVFKLGFRL